MAKGNAKKNRAKGNATPLGASSRNAKAPAMPKRGPKKRTNALKLRQVRSIELLSIESIAPLVSGMGRELARIRAGEIHSWRHTNFKQSLRRRGKLKNHMLHSKLSEEQYEAFDAALAGTFKGKSQTDLDYRRYVFLPECLLRMAVLTVADINSISEAAAYFGDPGDTVDSHSDGDNGDGARKVSNEVRLCGAVTVTVNVM